MQRKITVLALCAITGLTACGDTMGEQALIGAGAGAGAAIVTGGNAGTGAVVGAGANVLYCNQYPDRC